MKPSTHNREYIMILVIKQKSGETFIPGLYAKITKPEEGVVRVKIIQQGPGFEPIISDISEKQGCEVFMLYEGKKIPLLDD